MQICVVFALAVLGLSPLPADAGYYKSRPPPIHPHAKLHYGPKPPPHYFHKPPPFHGPLRRPLPIHASRPSIRPPPRPFIVKPTPPPPPPFPPASWKTHSTFHAPAVKETFHSAPLAYTPDIAHHFLRDDNKGPIHTIPAPNLSPADRPVHQGPASSHLDAVLRHGLEAVHSQSQSAVGYQVTEDPSAHKPYSGAPSYFAPDPDPSLPTIEVPKTMDPHSLPSNGQVPLDLAYQQQLDEARYQQPADTQQYQQHVDPQQYQLHMDSQQYQQQAGPQQYQQHADPQQYQQHGDTQQYQQHVDTKQYQQYQQQTLADGNSLSPQDLYGLLHGSGQQPQQQMTAALYQQYLQAAAAQQPSAYQQLFYPHTQQVAFSHPQFETFNYNEQTQEGAHGSDSFPSASSISVGVKRAVNKDTEVSGEGPNSIPSDHKGIFLGKGAGEESDEVGVISNQVDYEEEESTEENERETLVSNIVNGGYYTTLPNKQTAETLATLAAAGNINNQMAKGPAANEKEKLAGENTQQFKNEMRVQHDKENEKRQSIFRVEVNPQRNEMRTPANNDAQNEHYRVTDIREQQKENEKTHQYYDIKVTTNDKNAQNEKDNSQDSKESDYEDEEILDPSDKDLRYNRQRIQNTMRIYENTYRNRYEKETETPVEEQTYEDSDTDYSQEEEKEINNNNKATKLSTTDKNVNYNAHQNQLPFGAKLRPKRV